MKFHSKDNLVNRKGFSLIEAVAALGVLAVITSSTLVIVDRCMNSTANMKLRRNAFEIARENMEILLTQKTISEKTEFGVSEIYPEIEWQTTVEMFMPAGGSDKWLRAKCSSQYYDSQDETQTVELTAWLTMLSKRDVLKIQKQREILREIEGINGLDQPSDFNPDGPGPELPVNPEIDPSPDIVESPSKTKIPEEFWRLLPEDMRDGFEIG